MTKLTDAQKQQLDDLIEHTILPALYEDVCEPDMEGVKDNENDDVYEDRKNVLYVEALNYLKNNLI